MTVKEYIENNSRDRGGMLVIGPITEDAHYCLGCFKNDELTKVTHTPDPYGWTCLKGHFTPGQRLAKVDAWNLNAALKLVEAAKGQDPNVAVDEAFAAIIQLGYRTGAAAGNPISFLRDFFRTEINPVVEVHRKFLVSTISVTIAHMRKEGYSGPISQTVFAHAVLGDALANLMSIQPGLNWGRLSTPEWVSIAICFSLWLKGDASGAIKQLLADIEKAMDS